jgi:hypothetical protein
LQQKSKKIDITGQVFDQDSGLPIAGAIVEAISNSKITTISNFDGEFKLSLPENETHIVISFMGYAKAEVAVDGANELQISLKHAENVLDQVIVTALGVKNTNKSVAY